MAAYGINAANRYLYSIAMLKVKQHAGMEHTCQLSGDIACFTLEMALMHTVANAEMDEWKKTAHFQILIIYFPVHIFHTSPHDTYLQVSATIKTLAPDNLLSSSTSLKCKQGINLVSNTDVKVMYLLMK